ncbi:MAG: OmpA family protein [bacterium]
MKKLILSISFLAASIVSGFSQDDAEGCKDHAILTRMPTYFISSCSNSYNEVEVVTGSADGEQIRKTIEGNVSSIEYNQKEGNEGKLPSWFQIQKQEIQASEIFEKLNTDGYIALYINFETGKSDIKSESQIIIDQIAEMLKANPSLKISVEGHTDNVGTPATNKTLSGNRAKAVMNALIAQGIDKSRLSAKGWGQDKPISDNTTEEGKSENRRVEIVKL